MPTFRVRTTRLGEVSAQLQGLLAVFDGNVASVSAKVSAVSGISWEGDDQKEFAESFAAWQVAADAVRLSLTSLSMQLAIAEGSYNQNESGVRVGMIQRRQSQAPMVDAIEDLDESVDTGLERARTAVTNEPGGVFAGGAVTARTGRGEAGQSEPTQAAPASGSPSTAGAES